MNERDTATICPLRSDSYKFFDSKTVVFKHSVTFQLNCIGFMSTKEGNQAKMQVYQRTLCEKQSICQVLSRRSV